jgi:hypothetical protein
MTGAKADGNLVIINLQATKKDEHAHLKINGRCDDIMRQVMQQLQIPIPPYIRTEKIIIRCLRLECAPFADGSNVQGAAGWGFELISGGATDDQHLNYIREVTFNICRDTVEGRPSKKLKVEEDGAAKVHTVVRDDGQSLRWCMPFSAASPTPTELEVTIYFQPALRHGPCTINTDLACVVWDSPVSEIAMSWEHTIEVAREVFNV